MFIVSFLSELVRRTPVYAWVILALLLKRGVNASRDNVLSFPGMLIFPAVFVVWGLEEVAARFAFPGASILTYGIFAMLGTPAGYALYCRFRSFYRKAGVCYRTGTYMPLAVMLLNYLVKYGLNVGMSVDPGLYRSMAFNLFYSVLCGFSVGLTIGGVLQAYRGSARLYS